MTEFVGKFLNKIDKKGRVSVPALWRTKLLGAEFSGIVAQLTDSYNSVDGYSQKYLDRYQEWLDKQDPLLEGSEYEATLIFGSSMLPFDKEGRVLLPDLIRKKAQLDDFMIQEYLPGQNIAWDSFWFNGKLIASYTRERLEYPFKHISPSGITGTPTVSKIIVDEK